MPLPYMDQLNQVWQRFDQCMQRFGATTTHFNQFVWLKWHGNAQLMGGICDPLTLRWLIDRKQGAPSFVAGVMNDKVRAEIEQDALHQMGMNQLAQHVYAKQKLTQHGMQWITEGRVDEGVGSAILHPLRDLIRSTSNHYYYIIVTGVHRQTGSPESHTIGIDCQGLMLFDSDAGIATFTSLAMLAEAFCVWAVEGYPELELKMGTFKSFR